MLSKKLLSVLLFFILTTSSYVFFVAPKNTGRKLDFNIPKTINLNDNGLNFTFYTQANTVEEFLQNEKIKLAANDQVFPEKSTRLLPNMNIEILRAVDIKILVDG